MVTNAKRTFDAPSINQLMLAYTDLELKSNAYAGFLVESAKIGTFDTRKNDEYALGLRSAIDAFNVTYATLQSASPVPAKPSGFDVAVRRMGRAVRAVGASVLGALSRHAGVVAADGRVRHAADQERHDLPELRRHRHRARPLDHAHEPTCEKGAWLCAQRAKKPAPYGRRPTSGFAKPNCAANPTTFGASGPS